MKNPVNRDLKATDDDFPINFDFVLLLQEMAVTQETRSVWGVSRGYASSWSFHPEATLRVWRPKPLHKSGDIFHSRIPQGNFHFQYKFVISSGSANDYLHTILYTFIQRLS